MQHEMLIEVIGRKYAPPMAQVLADDQTGETKAILDLGCGSGNWCAPLSDMYARI